MRNGIVVDITGEVFNTSSELEGKRLKVQLKGCLDMDTEPALQLFLAPMRSAVQAGTVREIVFDVLDLYLMNSSSISRFAAWVKELKGMKPVCRIKFKTNPNLSWQRRTFDTIRRVAEQVVSVE